MADADALLGLLARERATYITTQGWSDGRANRARGKLGPKDSAARKAALRLQEIADAGGDVDAWAEKQGWPEFRLRVAKLKMEV